jgi:hypothetical protein
MHVVLISPPLKGQEKMQDLRSNIGVEVKATDKPLELFERTSRISCRWSATVCVSGASKILFSLFSVDRRLPRHLLDRCTVC